MYVGPTATSLYLWLELIVMAEGVQVSSSQQLPQQPGRLAQPLQVFGQMLNPLTRGFLLWLGPLSFPLPPTRWAVSGAALSGSETLNCCMAFGKSPPFFGFQFLYSKLKSEQFTSLLQNLQLSTIQKPELGIQDPLCSGFGPLQGHFQSLPTNSLL